MIVYSISHPEIKKNKLDAGSNEHKEFIFNKTIKKTNQENYILGHSYQVNGRKQKGTLVYICENAKEAEWEGLKVKLMELWFSDDETTIMYHPSDLKG